MIRIYMFSGFQLVYLFGGCCKYQQVIDRLLYSLDNTSSKMFIYSVIYCSHV